MMRAPRAASLLYTSASHRVASGLGTASRLRRKLERQYRFLGLTFHRQCCDLVYYSADGAPPCVRNKPHNSEERRHRDYLGHCAHWRGDDCRSLLGVPVLFTFATGSVPFTTFLNLFAAASLGCADRELLGRYFTFVNFFGLQTSMLMVYLAHNTAFLSLEGMPQLASVLLLPVIKIGFKYLGSVTQSEDDDLTPALHLSIDIFNALYMTKCMQSAGTLVVGFGIIVVDFAQNYVAIGILAKQTRSLQQATARKASGNSQSPTDLLPLVFERLSVQDLRFGSRSFSISTQSEAELAHLRSIQAKKGSNHAAL